MKNNHFLAKGLNVSCGTIDRISYIYLEDREELLKLDEVGSFIWNQVNGKRTVGDIVDICLEEYTGNKKEIVKHVRCFIGTLIKENMLVSSMNIFKGVMQNG